MSECSRPHVACCGSRQAPAASVPGTAPGASRTNAGPSELGAGCAPWSSVCIAGPAGLVRVRPVRSRPGGWPGGSWHAELGGRSSWDRTQSWGGPRSGWSLSCTWVSWARFMSSCVYLCDCRLFFIFQQRLTFTAVLTRSQSDRPTASRPRWRRPRSPCLAPRGRPRSLCLAPRGRSVARLCS